MPARSAAHSASTVRALRTYGLALPGAHGKSPWPGHDDLAVNDKTFAYLSAPGDPPSVSCKLPVSRHDALKQPGCSPTAYGLGKSGWVSCDLLAEGAPSLDVLKRWVLESYRAQAPKRLLAE